MIFTLQGMYDYTKLRIRYWCKEANIPMPKISWALDTDPCDVTDHDFIRLNPKAYEDSLGRQATMDDIDYYASHVFGHFLCDYHSHCGDNEGADNAADFISNLLYIKDKFDDWGEK